jgi:hypothetical protein
VPEDIDFDLEEELDTMCDFNVRLELLSYEEEYEEEYEETYVDSVRGVRRALKSNKSRFSVIPKHSYQNRFNY